MKPLFLTLLLALVSTQAHAEIRGYGCVGSEPFFNLQIKGKQLSFSSPGTEKRMKVSAPLNAMGMSEGYATVFRNKKEDVAVTIIEGKCVEDMSGSEYGYHMIFNQGSTVLYGCCERLAQHDD